MSFLLIKDHQLWKVALLYIISILLTYYFFNDMYIIVTKYLVFFGLKDLLIITPVLTLVIFLLIPTVYTKIIDHKNNKEVVEDVKDNHHKGAI